jgi:excisionase family DNA binding protein
MSPLSTSSSSQPLLSPSEAASIFGVPRQRIYELIQRGSLPSIRIGRLIRFRPDDVRAFIEKGGEASTSSARKD